MSSSVRDRDAALVLAWLASPTIAFARADGKSSAKSTLPTPNTGIVPLREAALDVLRKVRQGRHPLAGPDNFQEDPEPVLALTIADISGSASLNRKRGRSSLHHEVRT